jgi:hypothetical protein
MNKELEIPLKGDRDYLHGTDIYTVLVDYFYKADWVTSRINRFTLKFHSFAHSACCLVLSESSKQPKKFSAVFTVQLEDSVHRGWLTETGQPITRRTDGRSWFSSC